MKKLIIISLILALAFTIAPSSLLVFSSGKAYAAGEAVAKKAVKMVNINTASIGELITLKGIGEKTAQAIVGYREKNGPFKAIEDIKNIQGIGEKKFEAIKDSITVK